MVLQFDNDEIRYALFAFGATAALFGFLQFLAKPKTTLLNGPRSPSWLFGVLREVSDDIAGDLYEKWADQYGSAYCVPGALGSKRVVLFDPRAISHFFARDSYGYIHQENRRRVMEQHVSFLSSQSPLIASLQRV